MKIKDDEMKNALNEILHDIIYEILEEKCLSNSITEKELESLLNEEKSKIMNLISESNINIIELKKYISKNTTTYSTNLIGMFIPEKFQNEFKYESIVCFAENKYLTKTINNLYETNYNLFKDIKVECALSKKFEILLDIESKLLFNKVAKIVEYSLSTKDFNILLKLYAKGYNKLYRKYSNVNLINCKELILEINNQYTVMESFAPLFVLYNTKKIILNEENDINCLNEQINVLREMHCYSEVLDTPKPTNSKKLDSQEKEIEIFLKKGLNLDFKKLNYKYISTCLSNYFQNDFPEIDKLINFTYVFYKINTHNKIINDYVFEKEELIYAFLTVLIILKVPNIKAIFENEYTIIQFYNLIQIRLNLNALINSYKNIYSLLENNLDLNNASSIEEKHKYDLLKENYNDLNKKFNIEKTKNSKSEKKEKQMKKDLSLFKEKSNRLKIQNEQKEKEIKQLRLELEKIKNKDQHIDDTSIKPNIENIDFKINYLNNLNLGILGGNIDWANKLKNKISNLKIITEEDCNLSIESFKNKDIVFVHYKMPHGFYYKIIDFLKRNNVNYILLENITNINNTIDFLYSKAIEINNLDIENII